MTPSQEGAGELVLAAKITHVPSIWLSRQPGKFHGIRRAAEEGLQEVARRTVEAGADTYMIADAHWLNTIGFHINGKARHEGSYTSHELPHFIPELSYDYPGAPDLAELVKEEIANNGQRVHNHTVSGLGLEYASLIPMELMNDPASPIAVLPIGCNLYSSIDENRQVGEAIGRAIRRSGRKVAFLASGSLSHRFPENEFAVEYLDTISSEFNRTMDLRVLEMWTQGRVSEFLELLPEYSEKCSGEAAMVDTAMLFGLLGWDAYEGTGEILCPYFPSTGTGQVVVDFSLPEATPKDQEPRPTTP